MRINRFTQKVVLNVALPHVPADKIALNVERGGWYLDTFRSGHSYLVRAEYPLGVKVDEARVAVTFDGSNLCVKIPVVEGLEQPGEGDAASGPADDAATSAEPSVPPDPASRALWNRQTGDLSLEAAEQAAQDLTAAEKLMRMADPTLRAPKVGSVPMKHRKSTKHPEQFPTQQKKPKYTSDTDLLKIAKGASRKELLKQSAKLQAREQQERLAIQQLEAKKAQREMKKTRKRAIVERAKARLKE